MPFRRFFSSRQDSSPSGKVRHRAEFSARLADRVVAAHALESEAFGVCRRGRDVVADPEPFVPLVPLEESENVDPMSPHLIWLKVTCVSGWMDLMTSGSPSVALQGPAFELSPSSHCIEPPLSHQMEKTRTIPRLMAAPIPSVAPRFMYLSAPVALQYSSSKKFCEGTPSIAAAGISIVFPS